MGRSRDCSVATIDQGVEYVKRAVRSALGRVAGEDRARRIVDAAYRARTRASIQLRALPIRTEFELRRYARRPDISERHRRLVREARGKINAYDSMFTGDVAGYTRVALSALDCIESALSKSGVGEPKSILDMPSGSGRVLRYLARRFPTARLVACEIEEGDLEFCRKLLPHVTTVRSAPDFDALELPGPFDLIWCGSLITHLDADAIRALIRCFKRHLAPGGVVVFTTHGDKLLHMMETREHDYQLSDEQIAYLGSGYRESGVAYTDYTWTTGYGASVTSPEWIRDEVEAIGGLSETWFAENGWTDAQDVFAFVRVPDAGATG